MSLLSSEPVNLGRQREIDFIKAFSILMMIVCHCIEELFMEYGAGDVFAVIVREYENQLIGAQAFMICMGVGIVYSKSKTAKSRIDRGVNLLIIGQVLNLARYAILIGIAYLITGDVLYKKLVSCLLQRHHAVRRADIPADRHLKVF